MTSTVTDVQQPDYPKYQQTQRQFELTPEEIRLWQQCMKGSSILTPTLISAALGYGTCKITPFRANAKYAAVVGGVIGLVMSRIAVTEMCLRKVASMPNSTLRDRLVYRERQYEPLNVQSEIHGPAESSTEITFNDYPSMNSYDTYSSINPDHGDFSEETDLTEPINLKTQKGATYDELRHKNRDEFYQKNKQWYASRTREPPVAKETTEQVVSTPRDSSPMQQKTKYGDVWG